MDQREHYRDYELPAPFEDLCWWYEVIRNLVIAVGVAGFTLSVAGVLLVRVAEAREMSKSKWPPPGYVHWTNQPSP